MPSNKPQQRIPFHSAKDRRDPRVVAAVLQAPKWFPKGEVGDDVKSTPIVPARQVQLPRALFAVFVQLLDEEVDVLRDKGLLTHHRLRRESV